MKKIAILITLFFLFVNVLLHSQIPIDFPTENASWQEGYYISPSQIIPERRVLCGDTTINNLTYAKVFSIIFNNLGVESSRVYEGAIRNSVDRVLWVPVNEPVESVLYDFSLESTESITLKTVLGTENTITAKSNQYITTTDGVLRRVIVFASQGGGSEEVWIEGIGSNLGIIARGINPNEASNYAPFLNCYRFETQVIYTHPDPPVSCNYIFNETCLSTSVKKITELQEIDFSVFPNPFFKKTKIGINGFEFLEKPILNIYNLQGQKIKTIHLQNSNQEVTFQNKLSNGVYLFELNDASKSIMIRKKVVVGNN